MYEVEEAFPEMSTPTRNTSRQRNYLSVVPWQNAEQFIKVYEKLFSPCIHDKRWAVDQITVWETRCHPSLPTAIEATVVLVGAIIQDMLLEVGETLCRERDVQALYSMAIVRFVNLILQSDHREKLSILADQHNIPLWLIDLRHDAAHAHTPPLDLLRLGVNYATKYLRINYWIKEAANICQMIKTPTGLAENVFDVIAKFKNVQFLITEAITDASELKKDLSQLLKKIQKLVKNHKEKFVEALVKPGVFLSSNEIERLLNYSGETLFLELPNSLTLPDSLLTFWLAVIRMLHTADLISYFMEMLLLSLEHCTNIICQKTAVAWVIFFLHETYTNVSESAMSSRIKRKGVQLQLTGLLYASAKGANPFTPDVFREIALQIENNGIYSPISTIISVHQGLTLNKETIKKKNIKGAANSKNGIIVFTAGDLENDLEEEKAKMQAIPQPKNIWSLAPVNLDFSNLPLGAIISPAILTENVDNDVDMDASVEDHFIIEENDKEPTVEVESTPDINIFQDPEIGDMIYNR